MRLKPPVPTAKKSKRAAPVEEAEPLEVSEDEVESGIEIPDFDPSEMAADIAKLLKFSTFEPEQKYWLQTGSKDLNAALGSESRGLPYGKLYELAGAEHCLVGDTPIDCPRDLIEYPFGIPLAQLVGARPYVYAYDDEHDRFVVTRASRVWRVGCKKVYRLTMQPCPPAIKPDGSGAPKFHRYLNPDQTISGTNDHEFLMISGEYRRLDELRPGDHLQSLYRRQWFSGRYSAVHHPGQAGDDAEAESRLVLGCLYGEKDRGWDGHHKNENRLDNSPGNLEWQTKSAHYSAHARERNLNGTFGWQAYGIHPRGMAGKEQTEKQRDAASKWSCCRWREFRRDIQRRAPKRLVAEYFSNHNIRETAARFGIERNYMARVLREYGLVEQSNHKVVSVECVGYADVYDMRVPGYDNFVANGVVVHNCGKTTLATWLAGLAQKDGAGIGRIDLERSLDETWDEKMGLDSSKVYNIYPKLVRKKVQLVKTGTSKKKQKVTSEIPVLQSAEELFTETEMAVAKMADLGFKKQFWFLDSVANIETEMELAAGNSQWDMRVGYDRAIFLSRVLKKWAGIAANYNAMIFFLNQLRFKGGVVFGDPYDSPGGKALRHLCSIRARMRRCKAGEIKRGNRVVGLVSIVKNIKNKAGGGSVQSCDAGVRFLWRKTPALVEVMSKEDAESLFGGSAA